MLCYVNIEREKNGLAQLTLDSTLCEMACVRSEEIVDCWGHSRPNGSLFYTIFDEYNYTDYTTCGENIAAGHSTPQAVVEAWMNSEGHRANILNANFTKIGIGLTQTDSEYKYYWVQLFSN